MALTDLGQTLEAVTGIDDRVAGVAAIVHLAAIPAPGLRSNAAIFPNNMSCTDNVFAGAQRAGIKNVMWASSETVLGLPFDEPPPYVPVDDGCPGGCRRSPGGTQREASCPATGRRSIVRLPDLRGSALLS